MRVTSILVVSLLAFGGLAGCIGGTKDDTKDDGLAPAATGGTGGTGGSGTGTTAPPQLKVLAPLTTAVTSDAAAWIQSGTEIPVMLTPATNAKGTTKTVWAIGAVPGTVKLDTEVKPDTGSTGATLIKAGESKSLKYSVAGQYAMHCHPHPFMLHNVTVVDGYVGPKTVDVYITDGASNGEFRFVPENIVIGKDTTVNYKNVGQQPHTATAMGAQSPPLKLLPLTGESGMVKVDGEGWHRILAITTDSEGRLGIAEKQIYATATLPSFAPQTLNYEFEYGAGPLAGTPAEAASKSASVTLAHGGLVHLNYTFSDAAGSNGAPENLAEVEVHFTKDGETQDTLTGAAGNAGQLAGKAQAGTYTITVVPLQGALISGSVIVEVVYDLVPPPPAAPKPASDGHGHQH